MNVGSWKSTLLAVAVAVAVVVAAAPQAMASTSDLLLLHGHIYTGAPKLPWAEALAVTGSRIDAVGTDAQLSARRGPSSRVIDLHGRTVIPGIVDAHIHVWLGAVALDGFNFWTPEGR